MGEKFPQSIMRILSFILIFGLCAVGLSRPSEIEKVKATEIEDESDRELIRVARGDVEDEEPREKPHKEKKRSTEVVNKRNKRAAEEDAFFQALLTRRADKKTEKKRSFDEGADNTGYIIRDDWKGDSKISDADRQELESLFNAINSPDDEEKLEETRSLKPGLEGKVQQFIEWLMSQPPDKFTKSLSHILDVEHSLTKMFYDGQQQQQQQQTDQQQHQPQQQQQQQQLQLQQQDPAGNSNKNCKSKCFTLQLGNTECKIICDPPSIEQPTQAPAYGLYPQQYGKQYPYAGQMPSPCVPPACQPGQYPSYMPAQPYPAQGVPAPGVYSPVAASTSPVQEGCVGRSCDKKGPQSDKPAEDKQEKQDKPAPPAPKPAQAPSPYTYQTPSATVVMDPIRISQQPEPQIPVAPMIPGQMPMAVPQPQPYAVPQASPQVPYDISISGVASPQAQPQGPELAKYFKPMPNDCQDYSSKRCQVFLDWPTDDHNEIKASLRFKQNWHNDYKRTSTTKYKIFTTEVENAIKDVYTQDKNFRQVRVTSLSEEDMKVTANFLLEFVGPEYSALRYLSRAISNNYLQSMPVFRNTLLREGIAHHHRSIVATQKELDAVPKVKVVSSHKHEDAILTTQSNAYLGCFRDRKPNRDLPKQFTKYEMTPEWCVGKCKLAGYKYAGLQYGYLCFCGDKFGKYGRADDGDCDSLCFGDKTRNCGAFWHNSVFSIDHEKHEPLEKDEPEEQEDSGSGVEEPEDTYVPEHTEVANHLMKAAEAALKAAKKLLPHSGHGKSKRASEEELQLQSEDALNSLSAAERLMGSDVASLQPKNKEKRDAEGDGRDLLVAYLSDVGGYDRNYRDVGDEDENGSLGSKDKNQKIEYRRMLIDESGDGEFVEKSKNKQLKARKRREVPQPWDESFDGPKKMASRAAPVENYSKRNVIPALQGDTEDDISMLDDASGEDANLEAKRSETVQPITSEDKVDSAESGDEADDANDSGDKDVSDEQSGFENESDKPEESGESAESGYTDEEEESGDEANEEESQETNSARVVRAVESEHDNVILSRHRRELPEVLDEEDKPKARSKRQNPMLNDQKMQDHVKQGVDNIMALIVDIYQSRKTLARLEQVVRQMKQDVMRQMDVPAGKRQQAQGKLLDTIKHTVVQKVNELAQSIRQEVEDYKQSHQAVSQQAKEAIAAILDIPVFQDKVASLKSRIKKRAADIEKEYKKAKRGSEELPSILKEHFKRNAPADLKGERRLSRSHRDLNL